MARIHCDLSIVTVVLNDKTGLEKTIWSVQNQKSIQIEHVIVDGGSNDGSEILASQNSTITIESKPDGGIYPAMQRGAISATSKYLLFCNSGDLILGSSFLEKAIYQLQESGRNWGFGPIIEHTQRNTYAWVSANKYASAQTIIARKDFVPFPSFIIERKFFEKIGGLTNKYKIAGDFELICKAAQASEPVVFSNPVALFSAGGISYQRADLAWREEILIRHEIFGHHNVNNVQEQIKYWIRILKWKLGKLLDFLERHILRNRTSWRDRRAAKVPEKYLCFLS
jgi:GT2 family glycosyltransferase